MILEGMMGPEIMEDIHRYIHFLEECGYSISFSFIKNQFKPFTHELIPYDFHPHAVCSYLKQNPATAGKCVCNKRKLEAKGVVSPYYGCCYAGVEEFLFPVYEDEMMLLCIHISGYRGNIIKSEEKMKETSVLCSADFEKLYRELSEDVPSFEHVKSFVRPLMYMIKALHRCCRTIESEDAEQKKNENLYLEALRYIHENYSGPLSSSVLARELRYSESYLRSIFKKFGNISLQAKITEIRLMHAKRLLRGTAMSVTEVAFAVGFTDSNYFSSVFRKYEGITPSVYRKE